MAHTPTSKALRRQVIADFKERKTPRGIFAIRCNLTSETWVGSSPNLDAAYNSNWFQLRTGMHRNKSLQTAWGQQGELSFIFEVLEQFPAEIDELNLRDHMTQRKSEWVSTLSAQSL
jgi:hypothetical protein